MWTGIFLDTSEVSTTKKEGGVSLSSVLFIHDIVRFDPMLLQLSDVGAVNLSHLLTNLKISYYQWE